LRWRFAFTPSLQAILRLADTYACKLNKKILKDNKYLEVYDLRRLFARKTRKRLFPGKEKLF
jgi:hypothetical protein